MPASLWFLRQVVWVGLVAVVASAEGRAATPLAAVGFHSEIKRRGTESPPYQNRQSNAGIAELDGAIERGRAIYWEGKHADGNAVSAVTGSDSGVRLPPRFTACVNCHGHDARGKTEGDVSASDIRGETLSQPYDAAIPGSRRRVAYDAVRFFAALTHGVDSSGRTLDPRMPRYDLSTAEAEDVFTYLNQIASALNPGVTDDLVRIGFSATKDGQACDRIKHQRQIIAACFGEVNGPGGIFRRRIELVDTSEPTTPEASQTVLAIISLEESPGPTEPADEHRTSSATDKRPVPVLRLTACTTEDNENPTFSLFPGTVERAHGLIRYATTRLAPTRRSVALLYSSKSISSAVIEKITWAAGSLASVESRAIDHVAPDEITRELHLAGRDCLVLVGPSTDFTAFVASAQRLAWEPFFLWTEMPTEPPTLARAISLQPNLPSDVTVDARAAYSRWSDAADPESRGGCEGDFETAALAKLVVETLKNAGRDLSSERFIATLESAGEIRTGFVPPLLFGARRHVGSAGLYIVPVPILREQVSVEWISSE